jgi:predicted nucleotidyltransferase
MPVFRSTAQGALLAELLLHPEQEMTLTQLARQVGVPASTAHAEVERLVAAGLFAERYVGRARLLRAGDAPAVRPMTELVALTFGPIAVVPDEFRSLPGVVRVEIFGSWAARYLGEPGPPPNDLDVLVVGAVDRKEVYAAADRAEERLRIPVNPVVVRSSVYERRDSPLLRQLASSSTVTVVGGDAGALAAG